MTNDLSRRAFFEKLGAYTLSAAALSQLMSKSATAQNPEPQGGPDSVPWMQPATVANPNILVLLVDQLRWPCWLTNSGTNNQMATLDTTYLPNIFGQLRDNSYVFNQYYTAATMCTPSRATLLTGLYAPQTAIYETGGAGTPALNSAFPTWGQAIAALNSAYQNNVWWFGKWHLSDPGPQGTPNPLSTYGFKTRTYPGGEATNPFTNNQYYIPSADGFPNEGLYGGVNTVAEVNGSPNEYFGIVYANDQMIANDFVNWLSTAPATPWCATVSFVNPHDIGGAPGWFNNTAPVGNMSPVYYQTDFPNGVPPTPPPMPPSNPPGVLPYSASPAALLSGQTLLPSPWNWENLQFQTTQPNYVSIKPSYQYTFLTKNVQQFGTVNAPGSSTYPTWTNFLNWYYWLQNFVDQQIGAVLTALKSNRTVAENTIIIFTSDHGDFGGSHGLHDKGGAVYDESIHVPLYVHFPGQMGMTNMNQMCSSVDFFRFMCDLPTGGGTSTPGPVQTQWQMQYPDQMNRQSIWDFLFNNGNETRVVTVKQATQTGTQTVTLPYVLHTVDETGTNEYCSISQLPKNQQADNRHVVCLRTTSAKLAVYSHWAPDTTYWDGVTTQEYEFYDYSPYTTNNQAEILNDYHYSNSQYYPNLSASAGSALKTTMTSYMSKLGNWGQQGCGCEMTSGLIATELDAPLIGTGTDGNPLTDAQAAAQQAFYASDPACTM